MVLSHQHGYPGKHKIISHVVVDTVSIVIAVLFQVKLGDRAGLVPKSQLRVQQPALSSTSTTSPTQPLETDAKTTPLPAVCLFVVFKSFANACSCNANIQTSQELYLNDVTAW